jgi:hypothetical protein
MDQLCFAAKRICCDNKSKESDQRVSHHILYIFKFTKVFIAMSLPFRILSIDGGGIRGVLPGQVLLSLENRLKSHTGNSAARLADFFDLIVGTSTGGILACLYLFPDESSKRPLYSAQEAVNLYLLHGNRIFKDVVRHQSANQQEKYPSAPLEQVFKEYFGDVKLSELVKPCLITSYNILKRSTHFFTQHDARENPSCDYYLRSVARATSAAPTYFEPARVTAMDGSVYPLIDGGVFANNPAMCAYAEALTIMKRKSGKQKIACSEIFMVSVGTASFKRGYDYNSASGWGQGGFVPPVMDVLMSGAGDTIDYQVQQLFAADGCPENYVRINPSLGNADPAMDNASEKNLIALKNAGTDAAAKYDRELDHIVGKLCGIKE